MNNFVHVLSPEVPDIDTFKYLYTQYRCSGCPPWLGPSAGCSQLLVMNHPRHCAPQSQVENRLEEGDASMIRGVILELLN